MWHCYYRFIPRKVFCWANKFTTRKNQVHSLCAIPSFSSCGKGQHFINTWDPGTEMSPSGFGLMWPQGVIHRQKYRFILLHLSRDNPFWPIFILDCVICIEFDFKCNDTCHYTLKTGTPIEDVNPILKLLWGVSRPEIQLGVGIHSTTKKDKLIVVGFP